VDVPASFGLPVDKATWAILVIGIFFDNLASENGLYNFSVANVSTDHSLQSMICEGKLTCCNMGLYPSDVHNTFPKYLSIINFAL
jgi:hypothetical protein